MFELNRADVSDRQTMSGRVVEPLNVVEHIGLSLNPRPIILARYSFGLQ